MNCKDCYVEGCTHRPFPNETECVFRQWTAKEFDWQPFRNQVAKDILCHLFNDRYYGDWNNSSFVMQAIGIADELIKQLKKTEEE